VKEKWIMETKERLIKVILVVVALIGAIVSIGYSPKNLAGSRKGATTTASARRLTFERTPARLERGRYIVEGPAHCFQCHSDVNWEAPGAQPKSAKKGGGTIFPEEGFQWLVAPNITPDADTGAGTWTDEQFARAIREGIGHDGRRLFPMMPYMNFRQMSDEDLASVIAYVRSVEPVRNVLPKTMLPDIVKGSLPPYQPITESVPGPDMSDPVARGKYLVTLGNCATCHTPMNQQGQPLTQLAFAGGLRMRGPWGEITTANITPDASGISYYDEALFMKTLRTGHVGARKLNSIMPWGYYRNMTDDDLKSIFAYLRTLSPVQHRIDNSEPPTECTVCGGKHGFGELNDSEH
jgi:mono/diheme cytochrome c family protein